MPESSPKAQSPDTAAPSPDIEPKTRLANLTRVLREDPDLRRALSRWRTAVIRGAASGFLLRGGLHLVSLALLVLRRDKRQRREQSLWEKAVETWRYTAFLGSFSGVYVAVDEGLSRLFGKERCTRMLTWQVTAGRSDPDVAAVITGCT